MVIMSLTEVNLRCMRKSWPNTTSIIRHSSPGKTNSSMDLKHSTSTLLGMHLNSLHTVAWSYYPNKFIARKINIHHSQGTLTSASKFTVYIADLWS